ncbi:uncharacterized protein LOC122293194 [Carya illinoinensis]|uniref:uncharacterized protein LOC122293194 n=1 Tax=Carya illinoinensis TaxID=32201 RepID=UPI001C722C17|nr:uncharacterized protein LOC122293194 [Carya illinoinensis]
MIPSCLVDALLYQLLPHTIIHLLVSASCKFLKCSFAIFFDIVVPVKSTQKDKQWKQEREEDQDEPKRKEKRQKGGKSGFLAPLQLSDALVKFFGTGESELSRADIVKRIWD